MHHPKRNVRPFAYPLVGLLASVLMLALALAFSASPALADGDPASDVLATGELFLPQDAGIPAGRTEQLAALLAAARRSGFEIRVALIASSTDMGSVTELWRQPQTYARFLGQELALTYRGPLLVVMPNGFGLSGFSRPPASLRAVITSIRPAASGTPLAVATLTAVQRLAAKAGHPLSTPSATTTGPAGNGSPWPWIVLAAGGAIVIAAWAASLRARPLRERGAGSPST